MGSYPIVPAVTGANLANYSVNPVNGTLTIVPAGSATTLAFSNQNLTLTATVVSLTSGIPTGTVAFYEGQSLVGSGALLNGTAGYTASSFPAGNVVLTAQYSGDVNFTQSASPSLLVLTVNPASTSVTVAQAGSVVDTVKVAPAPGYTGTVQFSCGGMPQNSTCSFQPSSVTFTGTQPSVDVSLTIQTGVSKQAALHMPGLGTSYPSSRILAAALLGPGLFAIFILGRRRKRSWLASIMLLPLFLVCVTSCGGNSSSTGGPPAISSKTPPGTYTVQVVTSGSNNLSATTNLTLTVQ